MAGLVHLYYGDGKGKTTAGYGLALRFLGNGGQVLVARFLKSGASGECSVFKSLGVPIYEQHSVQKFTFQMSEEEKFQTKQECAQLLLAVKQNMNDAGLVLLDEVATAISVGMLTLDEVLAVVKNKSADTELVLTGHHPSEALIGACDYVSCIQKIRHPYDAGIGARKGIEW